MYITSCEHHQDLHFSHGFLVAWPHVKHYDWALYFKLIVSNAILEKLDRDIIQVDWKTPFCGWFKYNINGASKGFSGPKDGLHQKILARLFFLKKSCEPYLKAGRHIC